MLVLSRKQSERIRLGRDIVVTVVRVAGDKVRIGIEAPSDVVVLRDELEAHSGKPEDSHHQFNQTAGVGSEIVLS